MTDDKIRPRPGPRRPRMLPPFSFSHLPPSQGFQFTTNGLISRTPEGRLRGMGQKGKRKSKTSS